MSDFFDDSLNINLDGGAVETPDDLYAGNRVTKPGLYHVAATSVKLVQDEGKLPCLQIELAILDGTDDKGARLADQIEKGITHRMYLRRWTDKAKTEQGPLEEKQVKGQRAWWFGFGLITEADLAKPNVNVNAGLIEGRQAVVKVQKEKDWKDANDVVQEGGLKISWNNDCWPVTHPYVKDVHKNREALALLVGVGAGANDADLNDI